MKALVCGGRNYSDRARVFRVLAEINPDEVVQGGATGADRLAKEWAVLREKIRHTYPAQWRKFYCQAGPVRNQQMLDAEAPDLVIAFPGGSGTADMVRRAEKAGVEVRRIDDA